MWKAPLFALNLLSFLCLKVGKFHHLLCSRDDNTDFTFQLCDRAKRYIVVPENVLENGVLLNVNECHLFFAFRCLPFGQLKM